MEKPILNSAAIKSENYYHAAVKVFTAKGVKPIIYKSRDVFIDRKTALKHAEYWRHECLLCGYVTQA